MREEETKVSSAFEAELLGCHRHASARDPDPSGGDDQEYNMDIVMVPLTAVIDAADLLGAVWENLVAHVQSRQSSNVDENEFASHGADIIDVLTGLLITAQTKLVDTHHSEANAAHDIAILK